MGGSKKQEKTYSPALYDTGGLFGTSFTNQFGTINAPNSQMTTAGNTAWNGLNNTLNSLSSNDYLNDANFKEYQNAFNNQMQQNYDTSVLSSLANRGLMRSSGLQGATNSFANTLANQTTNLMDSYYNRLNNNLNNYQNTLSSLYNYITGVNTGSQNMASSVSNYNSKAAPTSNSNIGSLIGGMGSLVSQVKGGAK